MNENFQILINEFEKNKNLGWVASKRNGTTGIGYTFEQLLGKNEENFTIPDFNNIEIKTKHYYSKRFISLFNANPDGEFLFCIDKLKNKYDYPDKTIKNVNVFHGSIWSKKKN